MKGSIIYDWKSIIGSNSRFLKTNQSIMIKNQFLIKIITSNSLLSSNLSACWECRVENVKLSSFENVESRIIVDVLIMSRISKKILEKSKKSFHVTILKTNSVHPLHLMCRVMNPRHVVSICRCQFTCDIANTGLDRLQWCSKSSFSFLDFLYNCAEKHFLG